MSQHKKATPTSSDLHAYLTKYVQVITNDGQVILGTLEGFDQTTNIIISNSKERVFSMEGTETVQLGLYVIRGDNISVISEIDVELDEQIEWDQVAAAPIKPLIEHILLK